MQPNRHDQSAYQSEHVAGVSLNWKSDHIVMEWTGGAAIYSSAVYQGGYVQGDRIVNHLVPYVFDCSDPVGHLQRQCYEWEYEADRTVGLLTAAKLTHASVAEMAGDQCAVFCCATAGTSNAARAGTERDVYAAYRTLKEQLAERESERDGDINQVKDRDLAMNRNIEVDAENHKEYEYPRIQPGTINIMLAVEGRMTEAAMWNAMMTATEAKCAAMQDAGIIDRETGLGATGTTTDTIAIALLNNSRYQSEHLYAGTATTIGNAIGRLVYETVLEAVTTQHEN